MVRKRLVRHEESAALPEYPLLPVRDTVLFPNMVSPLFVGREPSMRAVEAALAKDQPLLVVTQRDVEAEEIDPSNLYEIGTEATVGRLLRMPDGTISVLVHGQRRVHISEFVSGGPFLRVRGLPLSDPDDKSPETEGLRRAVLTLMEKVSQLSRTVTNETYVTAMNIEDAGRLADYVASNVDLKLAERQDVLQTLAPAARLEKVNLLLARMVDLLELESKIHNGVQQAVDKTQREYFLREQMKQIEKELGETDPLLKQFAELREKVAASGMPEEASRKALDEIDRLSAMPPMSPELGMVRTYLDWLVALPWKTATVDNLDIKAAAETLEQNHYGLPKVKERILEYIAVKKLAADRMRSPILCFVGPPGVGKTSLGKSIAQALGRKFVRVSLGGIRDEAEIRGHRRTYVGALPGRIIQTMKTAGTVNPIFMLDEIDKIGADFRGDPSAALLEVLDPEQNRAFSDHYLDVPYNLSRVMFITTANILDPVPPALRDRMEVIELPGYIEEEKLHIAKRFIIPRQLDEHGLTPKLLKFRDEAIRRLIREYTHEAGVRNLERETATVCRKVAKSIAELSDSVPRPNTIITPDRLSDYLGPQQFFWGMAEEKDEAGVATGVAWTEAGGDILGVEVTLMEGKGGLLLTGQLGDVMKESAQAGLSYTRSHAAELGIDSQRFEHTDIHVHVPAGAIPKDGPSAGITMATALISAFTGRPVHRQVAMTGEITLRGRVLPIGGLKEKVLAAHRAGIKTFVLPIRNRKDLVEVPKKVMRALQFEFVERMDQVLPIALGDLPAPSASPRSEGIASHETAHEVVAP
jgi:ATP-dependent Lon protease